MYVLMLVDRSPSWENNVVVLDVYTTRFHFEFRRDAVDLDENLANHSIST